MRHRLYINQVRSHSTGQSPLGIHNFDPDVHRFNDGRYSCLCNYVVLTGERQLQDRTEHSFAHRFGKDSA